MEKETKKDFNFESLAKKLQELGISKKQAGELSFHFLELNAFMEEFKGIVKKIEEYKKSEKEKTRDLLGKLQGELEYHIIPNHLLPAKRILNEITNSI